MSNSMGPYMLVPVTEYQEMQDKIRWQTKALEEQPDFGRHSAEAFMRHFMPHRSGEWGHVSYCLDFAVAQRIEDSWLP